MPDPRRRLALALVFITPAFWGVNYLVARTAPGAIEPHLLALLRWLLAGALLALPCWPELRRHAGHVRADWAHYLVLGTLGMYICGAWVYIGGRTTAAVNIALIYALSPVLIALLSAVWLRERLGRHQVLGVVLALVGLLHVIVQGRWTALTAVRFVPGDAWILGATLAWTLYALLLKRWPSPLSPMARLAVTSGAGCGVLAPFAAWELLQSGSAALSPSGLGLALAAALFPGYGAYLAYAVMQRELGVARVSVVLYLGPLYAAGMAWLVLGEPLHAYHAAGMVLVLAGIYLVNRGGR